MTSKGVNSCIFDFPGEDEWRAEQRDGSEVLLQWSAETQDVSVISDSYFPIYFVAPRRSFEKLDFVLLVPFFVCMLTVRISTPLRKVLGQPGFELWAKSDLLLPCG